MFVYWGALKHFISRYTHCFKLMFCLYWHCQLNLTVFWIWLKFNINGDSYSIFSNISARIITASHIQLTFPCRTCSGLDSCLFTIQNRLDAVVRTFKPNHATCERAIHTVLPQRTAGRMVWYGCYLLPEEPSEIAFPAHISGPRRGVLGIVFN